MKPNSTVPTNDRSHHRRMRTCNTLIINRLFIIFILNASVLAGQSQNIDSLYDELQGKNGQALILSANALNKLLGDTTQFAPNDPSEYVRKKIIRKVIYYHFDKDNYIQVVKYAQLAVDLFSEAKDSMDMAGCYHTMGYAYQRLGMKDKAIESYYASRDILAAIGGDISQRRSRYVLNNIAEMYLESGNYDLAEKLYKQCINMINEQEADEVNQKDLATYLSNLAEVHNARSETLSGIERLQKLDEAILMGTEALELSRKYNDLPGKIVNRMLTIANSHFQKEEYDKATNILDEALELSEKNGLNFMTANIYKTYGAIEMETNNDRKAEEYFSKAIKIADENGYDEILLQSLTPSIEIARKYDARKALNYMEMKVNLKDSIYNSKQQSLISEFEVKYNTQEKESQIALQNEKLKQEKIKQRMLFAGIAACIIILFFINRNRQLVRRRNKELHELNSVKNKFFSIISHDLKNPAIAQRNALKDLIDNFGALDETTLKEYYQALLQSADSQVELLLNLLGWAQLETGRMPFKPISFDFRQIVNHTSTLIAPLVKEKNIAVNYDLPEGELIAYGDTNMISTVIRNLLTNAVKFTNKGGKIDLSLSSVNDQWWKVSIRDNGVGISEERVHTLFALDKQRSTLGTSGEKGSGLGLIICKEMVEQNGGHIEAASQESEGSTFCFTIPKKAASGA